RRSELGLRQPNFASVKLLLAWKSVESDSLESVFPTELGRVSNPTGPCFQPKQTASDSPLANGRHERRRQQPNREHARIESRCASLRRACVPVPSRARCRAGVGFVRDALLEVDGVAVEDADRERLAAGLVVQIVTAGVAERDGLVLHLVACDGGGEP